MRFLSLCEELFSGLIEFHNVTNLVRYIKTTKHCKVEIVAPSKFSCMCSKSSNAAVSSGKTFCKFHQHAFLPSEPPTSNTLNQYKFSVLFMEGNATSKHSDASKHGKEGNTSKHRG